MTSCGSCGRPADPHPYRHPVTPSIRCPEALTVPLPDAGDGYENASLVLQCERDAGHRGTHRYPGPITWTTPKETPNA